MWWRISVIDTNLVATPPLLRISVMLITIMTQQIHCSCSTSKYLPTADSQQNFSYLISGEIWQWTYTTRLNHCQNLSYDLWLCFGWWNEIIARMIWKSLSAKSFFHWKFVHLQWLNLIFQVLFSGLLCILIKLALDAHWLHDLGS